MSNSAGKRFWRTRAGVTLLASIALGAMLGAAFSFPAVGARILVPESRTTDDQPVCQTSFTVFGLTVYRTTGSWSDHDRDLYSVHRIVLALLSLAGSALGYWVWANNKANSVGTVGRPETLGAEYSPWSRPWRAVIAICLAASVGVGVATFVLMPRNAPLSEDYLKEVVALAEASPAEVERLKTIVGQLKFDGVEDPEVAMTEKEMELSRCQKVDLHTDDLEYWKPNGRLKAAAVMDTVLRTSAPEALRIIAWCDIAPGDGHLSVNVYEAFRRLPVGDQKAVMDQIATVWKTTKYVRVGGSSKTVKFWARSGWKCTVPP